MAISDAEWKWRAAMTTLLAEVKTNQDNMNEKLDAIHEASKKRIERLEKTTFGLNGTPGLVEQVRGMKGKWALVFGGIIITASAFINQVVAAFMRN